MSAAPSAAPPLAPRARALLTRVLPLVCLAPLAYAVYLQAWVSDDAYITFRTVDNFLSGHGLTWNVGYRVQVYTHPLWMALMVVCTAFSGEVFYTSMALGLATTLAAAAVVVQSAERRWVLGALVVALSASPSFVDFATSGLENPLTHLLLALFFERSVRARPTPRDVGIAALLGAALFLSRPDVVLLGLPPGLLLLHRARAHGVLPLARAVLLGLAPALLWEVFSVFYYASFVSNTAYAKLGSRIASAKFYGIGVQYLASFVLRDTVGAALVGGAVLATALFRRRDAVAWVWALGMLLYVGYVVRIGGDFMQGRFFTAPLFVGVLVLGRALSGLSRRDVSSALAGALAVALCGVAWATGRSAWIEEPPRQPPRSEIFDANGIADERSDYREWTSLSAAREGRGPLTHVFTRDALALRERPPYVDDDWTMGMRGYYGGARVRLIDTLGVADPLLARLPALDEGPVRAGHLVRPLPRGYTETLATGENHLEDPRLAAYWDRLRFAIAGPLFDPARVAEAIAIAFGAGTGELPTEFDWAVAR